MDLETKILSYFLFVIVLVITLTIWGMAVIHNHKETKDDGLTYVRNIEKSSQKTNTYEYTIISE